MDQLLIDTSIITADNKSKQIIMQTFPSIAFKELSHQGVLLIWNKILEKELKVVLINAPSQRHMDNNNVVNRNNNNSKLIHSTDVKDLAHQRGG